jgi:hypothetical protein
LLFISGLSEASQQLADNIFSESTPAIRREKTMAQKEQKPQKNNKKAPAKSLKEKRADKQAKKNK